MILINSYTFVLVERETSPIKLRFQLSTLNTMSQLKKSSISTVSDVDSTVLLQTYHALREKLDPKEFGQPTIGLQLTQLLTISHSSEPEILLCKPSNHIKMNINGKQEMELHLKLGTTF